jgi:pSer/pThr/pTyr-binding forkhead associated (FHA) protein
LTVLFKIVSGKKAGASMAARHFPVRIGRSMQSDIQLDDAAVWDEHLEISLNATHEFVAATRSNALATLNGTALAQPTAIRNGDVLGIGSANIQFWLADPGQRGLAFREWLTWIGIAIICMAQVALIYWLLST